MAVEKEVPIMVLDWIQHVWEKSKHDPVHATDPQFSRYKCPALQGIIHKPYGQKFLAFFGSDFRNNLFLFDF